MFYLKQLFILLVLSQRHILCDIKKATLTFVDFFTKSRLILIQVLHGYYTFFFLGKKNQHRTYNVPVVIELTGLLESNEFLKVNFGTHKRLFSCFFFLGHTKTCCISIMPRQKNNKLNQHIRKLQKGKRERVATRKFDVRNWSYCLSNNDTGRRALLMAINKQINM